MGTRKPGHNHGFEDDCAPSCDGHVDTSLPDTVSHIHPTTSSCYIDCPAHPNYGRAHKELTESMAEALKGTPTLGRPAREVLGNAILRGGWGSQDVPEKVVAIHLTTGPSTLDGVRIAESLNDVLSRFFRNNTKYARAQVSDLGAKGIMPDINRKTSVLMDRIWYDSDEVGESSVEVVDDLIGHLLLLRDKLTS